MTCNCKTDSNGNLLDIGCPEHGDWLSDGEMTELFKEADPYENIRTPRAERPKPEPLTRADWKYIVAVSLIVLGLIGSLFFAAWGSV